MNFGKNKLDILVFLSTEKSLTPKSSIVDVFKTENHFPRTIERTIERCRVENLIDCNKNEEFFITKTGQQILEIIATKKPAKKKHEYNNGLRCVKCGLNRKATHGEAFWFDGEKITRVIPECV